jgi:hypothetical protein
LELLTPPATPEAGCIRVFADKLDTPALRHLYDNHRAASAQ